MNVENLRTTALGAMAVGQTAFVLLYLTFPWWRKFLGRMLFFKATAFAILLDTYMAYRVFDFPNPDKVFTALYFLLAAGIWAQFFAFLSVRLHGRQAKVSGNFGEADIR